MYAEWFEQWFVALVQTTGSRVGQRLEGTKRGVRALIDEFLRSKHDEQRLNEKTYQDRYGSDTLLLGFSPLRSIE